MAINFGNLANGVLSGKHLTPIDFDAKGEPHLIEIAPQKQVHTHFFVHKGEEFGYLLAGQLVCEISGENHTLNEGDTIYLTADTPALWKNPAKKLLDFCG